MTLELRPFTPEKTRRPIIGFDLESQHFVLELPSVISIQIEVNALVRPGRRFFVERGFGGVGAVSGEFQRKIESMGEIFAFLEKFVDGHEVDEKTAFCINLVVEELFTNMVRHNVGGSDRISLSIERQNDHLHLELIDTDVEPFDPNTAEIPPVDAGIENRRPGGLGIYLVKKMVDDVNYDYETDGRRMRVTVTKTLEN